MATTTGGTTYVASTDLVANYPTASLALANRVDKVASGETAYSATSQTITVAQILQGVTVVQDSASATTVTLPTSSLVNGMQLKVVNINTGTVTISGGTINGSTTIGTQYQGLTLVYRSTGTAWYSTAEGSSPGLAIVAPTTAASGGGSYSLSGGELTFTGVTSISLNGVFTSTYENYRVIATSVIGSTTARVRMRLRASSTDATTAYYFCQYGPTSWSSSTYASTVGSNVAQVDTTLVCNASTESSWTQDIFSPNLTKRSSWSGMGTDTRTASGNNQVEGGLLDTASAYDGLTLYPTTGTFTGKIRVYGYKNS